MINVLYNKMFFTENFRNAIKMKRRGGAPPHHSGGAAQSEEKRKQVKANKFLWTSKFTYSLLLICVLIGIATIGVYQYRIHMANRVITKSDLPLASQPSYDPVNQPELFVTDDDKLILNVGQICAHL